MKQLDLPIKKASAKMLRNVVRRGLMPALALLLGGAGAQAQALDTTFTVTGTVHRDNNGTTNGFIDGPVISQLGTGASARQLYVHLLDQRDSVIDASPVAEDGTFTLEGVKFRSYRISLSAQFNPINSRGPVIWLPNAWVPTAEGQIIPPTSVNGDGNADLGIAVNASTDIVVRFGINQRPEGNPYNITNDVRDANGQNYIPHVAFSGADPEDGAFADGMIGRSIDLFAANGGILYYNGVPVTAATTSAGTRFSNFDTSKVRYMLLPWLPHNFAYSLVDSAGTPQYVPSVITMSVALPVELTSFTGYTANGINILEWSTASERVNSGFVIERSIDGNKFETVGEVPSQSLYGSSSAIRTYSFRDNATRPDIAVYYYRLRQTDFDGTIAYSKIVKLTAGSRNNNKGGSNAPLSTFPNPSNGMLTVDWTTGNDAYQLAIRNSTGSVVMQRSLNGAGGNLHSTLDLSSLPAGNYFITLRAGELQQTRQITLVR